MTEHLLLWLFVIDLGIVLGAGLYEARISVPRWIASPAAAQPGWHPDEATRDDTGRRFWGFTTTGPLTLLTIRNLWAAWHSSGAVQPWWWVAGLAALGDRVLTFSYFIPRMIRLMRLADSSESRELATKWANLNWLRQAFVLVAWVAALQALTRFGA